MTLNIFERWPRYFMAKSRTLSEVGMRAESNMTNKTLKKQTRMKFHAALHNDFFQAYPSNPCKPRGSLSEASSASLQEIKQRSKQRK